MSRLRCARIADGDRVPARGFHYVYASVVGAVVVVISIWAAWRLQTKRAERARLLALLVEFREG